MKMNAKAISGDLKEAREQIDDIIARLESQPHLSQGEYQVMLQHAFRHLNFAWNARKTTPQKYQAMSRRDFNRWSKFPKGGDWNEMRKG